MLATALRPEHGRQGKDAAPAAEASSSSAQEQTVTSRNSESAEGPAWTQMPAFSAAATVTSDDEHPAAQTQSKRTSGDPATGRHEPVHSDARLLPQQQVPTSHDMMSRERSSSLQSWQLPASAHHTAAHNPLPQGLAGNVPAVASSSLAGPARQSVQADASASTSLHPVTSAGSSVQQVQDKGDQATGGRVASEPGAQHPASNEAAVVQDASLSAATTLQRSISLHANPKDSQSRWATPLFPTLGSMTESQAESLNSPDLDAVPSSSLASALKQDDVGSQATTDDQPNASLDRAGPGTGHEVMQEAKPIQAAENSIPAGQSARRVSFAPYVPEALQLEASPSEPEATQASGIELPDVDKMPVSSAALRSQALDDAQSQVQETSAGVEDQSNQSAADEFDLLVARKDSLQRSLRNEMGRAGTLEHVSSLSWRRSFLLDLEDSATGDDPPLEKRSRSNSLQQAHPLSWLASRSQIFGSFSRPASRAASQASLQSLDHSNHDMPSSAPDAEDHASAASLGLLPADDNDWQSLVVKGQVQHAPEIQEHEQEPLGIVSGRDPQRHDGHRLDEHQEPATISLQTTQSPLQEKSAEKSKASKLHASQEHHVTFASDEAGNGLALEPSGDALKPDPPQSSDQNSVAPVSIDQALLSQCLNGR